MIGYGSLMESSSKRMTDPDAGMNQPVFVTGFQRGWNLHGTFYNTYLGVHPERADNTSGAARDYHDEAPALALELRKGQLSSSSAP